jgi:hypothetical protein
MGLSEPALPRGTQAAAQRPIGGTIGPRHDGVRLWPCLFFSMRPHAETRALISMRDEFEAGEKPEQDPSLHTTGGLWAGAHKPGKGNGQSSRLRLGPSGQGDPLEKQTCKRPLASLDKPNLPTVLPFSLHLWMGPEATATWRKRNGRNWEAEVIASTFNLFPDRVCLAMCKPEVSRMTPTSPRPPCLPHVQIVAVTFSPMY